MRNADTVRPPTLSPPGFDFTGHMRRLCADMVSRLEELRHIDLDHVAVSFCQTRKAVNHGLHATLTPLRFEQGSLFCVEGGRRWTVQRLFDDRGREMLYILSFYLPRFLEGTLREKLSTVLHELWHISPRFDGDLRRFPGRCYMHSSSQDEYDALMDRLADRWLSLGPDKPLYDFLRSNFGQLRRRYGRVYGLRVGRPKVVAVA